MHQQRCSWVPRHKSYYIQYHDEEWGVPVHDDNKLFELLILEGAQAGLSWETVLQKRKNYNAVFYNFHPGLCATMADEDLDQLVQYQGIIRNRLKIYSVRQNAAAYLRIQQEQGSFSQYIWNFVQGKSLVNAWADSAQIPASTPLSNQIAKDLKKRGMRFVGATIIYAFMQAAGLVNDHTTDCFRYQQILAHTHDKQPLA